jgi:predicted TIM-barrel fold metal-dependent hydrolase
MQIVDAQVHIWANHRPIFAMHRPLATFSKDDILKGMDEAGVDATLLHPPSWDPNANDLAIDAARQHPDRFAIMGRFELDQPENRKLIDGWKSRPGMLGLRYTFLRPDQKTWMTDGTIDWLWPAAERAGIPISLFVSEYLPVVARIAERHPGLKLIVDHFGRRIDERDAPGWASLPELLALAKYPNVAVKATAAPDFSTDPYPYRNIHGYIRQVYDAFGPERMFWGTDITRLPCSWRQAITMFTEEMPWLSERDKTLIMGEAVCTWLGWARPERRR